MLGFISLIVKLVIWILSSVGNILGGAAMMIVVVADAGSRRRKEEAKNGLTGTAPASKNGQNSQNQKKT